MELARQRHSHTRTSVHVSLGERSDESSRNPMDGLSKSRLLRTCPHAGRSSGTGVEIYTGGRATHGSPGSNTPYRLDPRVCRHHGEAIIA